MAGRKSAEQRPSRTQAASPRNKPSSSRDIARSGQLSKPQAAASLIVQASGSQQHVTRRFEKTSTTVTRCSKKISGTAGGHYVQASTSQVHVTHTETKVTEHVKNETVYAAASGRSDSGRLPTTVAGSSSRSDKKKSTTAAKQHSGKSKPGSSSPHVKKH